MFNKMGYQTDFSYLIHMDASIITKIFLCDKKDPHWGNSQTRRNQSCTVNVFWQQRDRCLNTGLAGNQWFCVCLKGSISTQRLSVVPRSWSWLLSRIYTSALAYWRHDYLDKISKMEWKSLRCPGNLGPETQRQGSGFVWLKLTAL